MSAFRVGMKVRVNCPESPSGHHGKETVISALSVIGSCFGRSYVGHEVALLSLMGQTCVYEPHELIPILDRPELVEWSACAWSPHGVGVQS